MIKQYIMKDKIGLANKNILIAKWLGWEVRECISYGYKREDYFGENSYLNEYLIDGEIPKEVYLPEIIEERYFYSSSSCWWSANKLKFHSDSNWQWLCLEKIAKIKNVTIANLFQNEFWEVNSKEDLFEAIIKIL